MALREIPYGAERIMISGMVPFLFYKWDTIRNFYTVSQGGDNWVYSCKSTKVVLRQTVSLNSKTGMRILQSHGFIGIPVLSDLLIL